MIKKLVLLIIFSQVTHLAFSQQLNCTVIVNSDQIDQTNKKIFKTLQNSLNDYVNQAEWTSVEVPIEQRLQCSFNFIISYYDVNSGTFRGTLQIQSNRPVYNTIYQSPVFNFQDKNITFNYVEFEPLYFNPNIFESNLTAIINYYIYIILGVDADTFKQEGGTEYFNLARNIVTIAQGNGYSGWEQTGGNSRTRFELIDNLLSKTFSNYRSATYTYHRLGIDYLVDNPKVAKEQIIASITLLSKLNNVRPNSFVMQAFFDAKSEEISQIFSGGPKVDVVTVTNTLNKIAPLYSDTWRKIKY